MFRQSFLGVVSFAIFFFTFASADDTKSDSGKEQKQCCHAMVAKVSPQKDAITVKMTDKSGQSQEKTFQISKDTKICDCNGKTAKIDDLKEGDDVVLTQNGDKLTQIKESDEATITKFDPRAGTLTLKMKDQDGKEVEKVFRLTEDAEYLDSTGRVAKLEVFRSGDQVLVIEGEGKITGLKKSDKKSDANSTASRPETDDKKSDNR